MAIQLHKIRRGFQAARAYNTLDFFPLRSSLRNYNRACLAGDLRAGINVALLAFPQGMAYALIAGLPIEYGIYGSAVAVIVGSIFSKSHFIILGPTNATAVLLLSAFTALGVTGSEMLGLLPLLVAMVGFFIILAAYLKVANLIQYISRSVITGYITAAACLIITNQLPKALGLALDRKGGTFFDSIGLMLAAIETVHWMTVALSLITAGLYFLLNRRYAALPNVAICLILVSSLATALDSQAGGVLFLGAVNTENWTLQAPAISLSSVQLLISPALAIALLCVLEGISMGKALAAKTGARLDTNQAMFSIGMANLGCAFFSGMPASGSLTRSVLSASSGAHSVAASFIAGSIVLLGAFTVGPFTVYIPQSALAVLVIIIGFSLINRYAIRIVTRTTKSDAAVFATTFLGGLFLPLDTAIYLGVGISILFFLKKVARPEMVEYTFNAEGQLAQIEQAQERSLPEVSIVHVEGELFFGAADLFRDQIRRVCEDPNLKIVILKMRNAHNMDATAVMALEELLRYMNERHRYLILSEVKEEIDRVLRNSGLYDTIEARNIFEDEPSNPTLSTAKALKRAKEHLGTAQANVSIYVDPIRDKQKRGERH